MATLQGNLSCGRSSMAFLTSSSVTCVSPLVRRLSWRTPRSKPLLVVTQPARHKVNRVPIFRMAEGSLPGSFGFNSEMGKRYTAKRTGGQEGASTKITCGSRELRKSAIDGNSAVWILRARNDESATDLSPVSDRTLQTRNDHSMSDSSFRARKNQQPRAPTDHWPLATDHYFSSRGSMAMACSPVRTTPLPLRMINSLPVRELPRTSTRRPSSSPSNTSLDLTTPRFSPV